MLFVKGCHEECSFWKMDGWVRVVLRSFQQYFSHFEMQQGWTWKAMCNEVAFRFGKNLAFSGIQTRDPKLGVLTAWPSERDLLFRSGWEFGSGGGRGCSSSRLFHPLWAKSVVRWGKNGRSPRKTTWPPASRTWFVSHVTRDRLKPTAMRWQEPENCHPKC